MGSKDMSYCIGEYVSDREVRTRPARLSGPATASACPSNPPRLPPFAGAVLLMPVRSLNPDLSLTMSDRTLLVCRISPARSCKRLLLGFCAQGGVQAQTCSANKEARSSADGIP